jgi:hypothetical protein
MLDRITNPQKIREVLDGYVKEPEKQKVPFVAAIFSRQHRPGGTVYEGHRPIAAWQFQDDRAYTLATSDTNYKAAAAVLNLKGIEYIEVLR